MTRSMVAKIPDYQAYLRSDVWKVRRAKVFVAAKGTCLGCGRAAECVHHRTYDRLGQEADADLVALCWGSGRRSRSARQAPLLTPVEEL